jgi:hypothetical protein
MVAEADPYDGGKPTARLRRYSLETASSANSRVPALFPLNPPPEEAIYQARVLRFRLIT